MVQRSFLKWTGGKQRSILQILEKFPDDYDNYIEPFLGSGSVFFNLKPKTAFLSDINQRLMYTFICVKYNSELVIDFLSQLDNSKEDYYGIRDIFNNEPISDNIRLSSHFIYLNKCGYNGLYRVNSDNKFNVPYGSRDGDPHKDYEVIRQCSKILSSAVMMCSNYNDILSLSKGGDLVYLDPPYVKEDGKSFIGYNSKHFDLREHRLLSEACRSLDKKGVRFALSNSNVSVVRDLYHGFNFHDICTVRSVSRDPSTRGSHGELLITNY